MKTVGIIPARMASSRFPGKPLALIGALPMIGHVYYRSRMCAELDAVYVATCDEAIAAYIEKIGGEAIMTSPLHERASDRVAEAMQVIEGDKGVQPEIVVLIQGDEPMLTPEMINAAVKGLRDDPAAQVVNLMAPISELQDFEDPNEVKVVFDRAGCALYFSREAIPSRKMNAETVPMYKQVCVIPFRRDFLFRFNALEPTPLEIVESIDMLRVLEHGYRVKMVESAFSTYSVDTEEDLRKVTKLMAGDQLIDRYPHGKA